MAGKHIYRKISVIVRGGSKKKKKKKQVIRFQDAHTHTHHEQVDVGTKGKQPGIRVLILFESIILPEKSEYLQDAARFCQNPSETIYRNWVKLSSKHYEAVPRHLSDFDV